jgi:GT2 family glycosyltransferase
MPQVKLLRGGRVIVVDNASGDDSVPHIRAAVNVNGWGAWCELIESPRNGGFAYGNNLAIDRARRLDPRLAAILFLNPDTVVRPGALRSLLSHLDTHSNAGIVGAAIEDEHGMHQRSAHPFPSPRTELVAGSQLDLAARLLRLPTRSEPAQDRSHPCDWVSGACFAVRREVFEQIGGLDEGFFLYFEEVDFCRRARRAGWSCWYVADARVVHHEGSSTGIRESARRRPPYWFASRRRYFSKAYGTSGLIAADVLWAIGRASYLLRRAIGLGGADKLEQVPPCFALDLLVGDVKAIARGDLRGLTRDLRQATESDCAVAFPAPGAMAASAAGFGVVAIGRNEGERLRRCLESVVGATAQVVYVDSGSTDGSVELARRFGADVVALDMRRPFTAARARNEGWRRLAAAAPSLAYVQFVDGDCEIVAGWLDSARSFLDAHADVAAVAGRNRERFPERSIYNLLCDIEWGSGVAGPAKDCGGNAMMRLAALQQSGGFRETLIAGEEPELCVRMRAAGWRIWRLDDEMTLHDAAMTRFGQWWKRSMRTGFSYAEGVSLHGAPPEQHWVRESRSAWLWGVVLPIVLVAAAVVGGSPMLLGFVIYPLKVLRLYLRASGSRRPRLARAAFLVLGKFPEAAGQIKFLVHRLSGTHGRLIEYK